MQHNSETISYKHKIGGCYLMGLLETRLVVNLLRLPIRLLRNDKQQLQVQKNAR
jgi:hypothetical protein